MSQHAAGSAAAPVRAANEESDYQPFSFRRILPVGQLVLCLILLWPYRSWIAWELFGLRIPSDMPRSSVTVNPDGTLNLTPNPQWERWFNAQENTLNIVAALNLPAGVVQVPSAIFSDKDVEWSPSRIDSRVWHAVTWPLLSLPFWWMAGRGLEAFFAARRKLILPRLRWPETTVAFLLMAGGWIFSIGFLLTAGPDRADRDLQTAVAGSTIWAVLGTLTIAAKLAQWRVGKNQRAALSRIL